MAFFVLNERQSGQISISLNLIHRCNIAKNVPHDSVLQSV